MKNEKPIWIIGSLLTVLLLPATFVAGLIVGNYTLADSTLASDTLSAWVASFATVAIAVLTFILALETWKLRRAQDLQLLNIHKSSIQPQIEIYLESSKISFQFMNVNIENVGKGIAKDVSFEVTSLLLNESSHDGEMKLIADLKRLNLVSNGITSLGVARSRSSFLFSFIELSEQFGDSVFSIKLNITIRYSDMEGTKYTTDSIIDLSEYKGIVELGNGDPLHNISKEVEATRKLIDSLVKGNKRLKVNVHTKSDRDEETAFLERKRAEYFKRES